MTDFQRTRSILVRNNPAAAAETVIAVMGTISRPLGSAVDIEASCDFTVGTAGVAAILRIRRGQTTAGTLLATFGPFTVAAANRVNLTAGAVDIGDVEFNAQSYALTLQVTSATGVTTVNNVFIGGVY